MISYLKSHTLDQYKMSTPVFYMKELGLTDIMSDEEIMQMMTIHRFKSDEE